MKSTAKAEAWLRDLKEKLELRGLTVVESKDSNAWPELTINTDQAYIQVSAIDAVSKDVFGNDNTAFAPHELIFAIDEAIDLVVLAKLYVELGKLGIKLIVKSGADLATAKAAAGDAIEFDIQWPKKGM